MAADQSQTPQHASHWTEYAKELNLLASATAMLRPGLQSVSPRRWTLDGDGTWLLIILLSRCHILTLDALRGWREGLAWVLVGCGWVLMCSLL